MADNIKLVRIFIASPTGLEDERRAVRDIAEEINETNLDHWRLEIRVVGWEDTVIGFRRPQEKINEDLDKCDYFFGFLYNWWGSPPSLPGEGYTSGFEEEYNRAVRRKLDGKLQDIALFFRSVEIPAGLEPGDGVKKVKEFRQKCIDEKEVFFRDYKEMSEFKVAVRKKIFEIGWSESYKNSASELHRNVDGQVSTEAGGQVTIPDSRDVLFSPSAANFIVNMTARKARSDGRVAGDIARTRLIAISVSASGNDLTELGNHDSNLVFRYFRHQELSEQEYRALCQGGVAGFMGHNVPIWHWLVALDGQGSLYRYIGHIAVWGVDLLRLNAIRILECARRPIPEFGKELPKELILRLWFAKSANNQVFDAANRYLSNCASMEDISAIEAAFDVVSPSRKAQLDITIVWILARSSAVAALRRIIDRELDNVPRELAEEIFKKRGVLETDTLKLCTFSKSEYIRLMAVQTLFERREIKRDCADILLSDTNLEIRFLAIEIIIASGDDLSDEEVRKALIVNTSRGSLLFGSQVGLKDTTKYDEYRINRLSKKKYNELIVEVDSGGFIDDAPLIALLRSTRRDKIESLRALIDAEFTFIFESERERINQEFGKEGEALSSRLETLQEYRLSKIMREAVNALCRFNCVQDIARVRHAIDQSKCFGSEVILNYIVRFGDWSDIGRILGLESGSPDTRSLISFGRNELDDCKARAIAKLCKGRLGDFLTCDMDMSIKGASLSYLDKSEFRELDDERIMDELFNENEEYRGRLSSFCAITLSKKRLTGLLNGYIVRDRPHYYNVIHWLDLGISLPRADAGAIVQNVFN